MGITTILWREWVFFKHRFLKITASQMVSPLLYLLTFGYGLDHVTVEGQSYLFFIVPGLLAMTSMRQSYSGVAMRISVARLHERSFETYVYAPLAPVHLVIGYILSGALRGFYAGLFVVLIALIAQVKIYFTVQLFIVIFLNGLVFASIGFIAAMLIDTHYDLTQFSNFVITPMSFLCGTFYSVSGLPVVLKHLIECLPLTHTTRLIRRLAFGYPIDEFSLLITVFFIVVLVGCCIILSYEEIK